MDRGSTEGTDAFQTRLQNPGNCHALITRQHVATIDAFDVENFSVTVAGVIAGDEPTDKIDIWFTITRLC